MPHESLFPELVGKLNDALPAPPVAIVDIHMHVADVKATRVYVEAAESYGIVRAVGLTHKVGEVKKLRKAFGEFFEYCGHLDMRGMERGEKWSARECRRVDRLAEDGYRFLKLKVVPLDHEPAPWYIDDERLGPVLARLAERGMMLQIHIAQPDCWWGKHFAAKQVGTKLSYFDQVENVLAAHPTLKVLGVHLGCHAEDLEHLSGLLRRYPNYLLDTSATKWVVRELSAQHEAARAFFVRWRDRIAFGSDLVVHAKADPTYYTSRFHVQRTMWESDVEQASMIRDPDAGGQCHMRPLALPEGVLRRVYRDNALVMLG